MNLSATSLESWLLEQLAHRLERELGELDPSKHFQFLGLDSARALAWIAHLAEKLGRPLSPTLIWDHPTPRRLAQYLAGESAPESAAPESAPELESAWASSPSLGLREPIALVGLSCRFPGAADPSAFWKLLTVGVDAVGEVPPGRWDVDAYYDPAIEAAGKMVSRRGGFLAEIERFDAAFFRVSPREACHMDPQQRIFLELVWEALEDAGLVAERLRGSRTGVFVGTRESEYGHRVPLAGLESHSATGQDTSVLSGRVSYVFDFKGPSLTLNTACSSSLTAVHLACESLRRGESEVALAGGMQLMLRPYGTVALSKFGGLAPDGRCKPFDARADGFVRGEGGGVVVLKPLSRALADGDPVYCVIRGGALNNDGASNGLTAPSAAAQEAMLRSAYAAAGVDPAAVHYVEAHGTGTLLGDPIEARALGTVLGVGRSTERRLRIGSVKSNLGHLEAAAGVAGLIKTALALRHRYLPASLHFETPNPHIPFEELGLVVQGRGEAWPETNTPDAPAVAGVNAFGFSGTNCHLVLAGLETFSSMGSPWLEPAWRPAGGTRNASRAPEDYGGGSGRLVFVFSGNGCQWPGMARDLLVEPVFHRRIVQCDEVFRGLFVESSRQPISVMDLLSAPEGSPEPARLFDGARMGHEAGQLALFAIQLGLVDLWRSWGVMPDAVVGHSDAESAAAYVAGALDFESAARVIYQCARLQRPLAGHGSMVVVALSRQEVEDDLAVLATEGRAGDLGVAALNSRTSTLVSGSHQALAALVGHWDSRGVESRPVKVDMAAHGVALDSIAEELAASLGDLRPRPTSIPMASTVDVGWASGTDLGADYWPRNLRRTVLFAPAVELLLEQGHDHFLEISPHPVLARPLAEMLGERGGAYQNREGRLEKREARPARSASGPLSRVRISGRPGSSVAGEGWGEGETQSTPNEQLPSVCPPSPQPSPSEGEGARRASRFPERGRVFTSLRRGTSSRIGLARSLEELAEAGKVCPPREPEESELIALSAHTPEALRELATSTRDFLEGRPDVCLRDLAWQRAVKRGHLEYRLSLTASSVAELRRQLAAFETGAPLAGSAAGRRVPGRSPKQVWVFAGQGGQWPGMGRRLLITSSEFRRQLEHLDAAIGRHLDPPGAWSVLEELRDGPRPNIDVIQPVLFAVQVALAETLRSWGLEPDAVAGQSMGEVAAARVAGILTLDDAAAVICRRSRLLLRNGVMKTGAMMATECSAEEALAVLQGEEDRVALAVIGGPRSTVLSGERQALERIAAKLDAAEVYHRWVQVDVASHSPQMDPLKEEIRQALQGLQPKSGRSCGAVFYSTVRSQPLSGTELGADYWVDNLRRPVRLWSTVELLAADGFDTFVEIGPHPVLATPIENGLAQAGHDVTVVGSLRRDEDDQAALHRTLGILYAAGCDFDWSRLQRGAGHHLRLPPYPWQRQRFWVDDVITDGQQERQELQERQQGPHPYVGPGLESSLHPGTRYWEGVLDWRDFPELADHRVALETAAPRRGEKVVLVAAAHQLDLVAALLTSLAPTEDPGRVLEEVKFHEPLKLEEGEGVRFQVAISVDAAGSASPDARRFQIASRRGEEWIVHCSGRMLSGRMLSGEISSGEGEPGGGPRSAEEHLATLARHGVYCGPASHLVRRSWRRDGEVEAEIVMPDGTRPEAGLVDAAMQLLVVALPGEGDACLGHAVDRVWLASSRVTKSVASGQVLRARARLRPVEASDPEARFVGEVTVWDTAGRVVLETRGVRFVRVVPAAGRVGDTLLGIHWHEEPRVLAGSVDIDADVDVGRFILLADRGGIASRLKAKLEARGAVCLVVETVAEALAEAMDLGEGAPCKGIVHLRGLDLSASTDPFSHQAARDGWEGVLEGLRGLVKQVDGNSTETPPRFWVVTRQSLASALAEGLMVVARAERPELRPTVVDLGVADGAEIKALVETILAETVLMSRPADRVALRGGRRLVPHAVRLGQPSSSASENGANGDETFDGTWLVTGGLGGLGLWVARGLVEEGVRHLLLVGRSVPSADARIVLRQLEDAGVTVRTAQVDVRDRAALAVLLEKSERSLSPLAGVIHAAGVIDDDHLEGLDVDRVRRVLGAKALGAWNLHQLTRDRLTRDRPPRAFVLFSSVASVLGLPGQGAYAAANAFLDSLARVRRQQGLPAVSVNWPGWSGLGFATTSGGRNILRYLERRGVAPLAPTQGVAVLRRILREPGIPAQVMVLPLDEERLDEHARREVLPPFWASLTPDPPSDSVALPKPAEPTLRAELQAAAPARRRFLVEERVRHQAAQVLGLEDRQVDRHRPWRDLGLESLMAVELRGRLETLTGLTLSTTLVWRKPCLVDLAEFLADKLAPQGPSQDQEEAELAALLAELGELSDEESQELLG